MIRYITYGMISLLLNDVAGQIKSSGKGASVHLHSGVFGVMYPSCFPCNVFFYTSQFLCSLLSNQILPFLQLLILAHVQFPCVLWLSPFISFFFLLPLCSQQASKIIAIICKLFPDHKGDPLWLA